MDVEPPLSASRYFAFLLSDLYQMFGQQVFKRQRQSFKAARKVICAVQSLA